MLVLTRRFAKDPRETSVLVTCPNGDIITVCLNQIKGKQARIGIETPEGYIIDRAEVYEERKATRDQELGPILKNHF